MSKKPLPGMPPIPPTPSPMIQSRAQAISYLRMLANLIETGSVEAFDLQWSQNTPKVVGQLAINATFVEPQAQRQAQAKAEPEPESTPIPVEDWSEKIRNPEKCNDPECKACNCKD